MIKQNLLILTVMSSVLALQGCSFSASSKSSSTSSESLSSLTSSGSSSDSQTNKKYTQEVSDYTTAYVKSSAANADYNSFAKGISDIAAKAGISNWEQESSTYVAIGQGLKRAGATGAAYDTYKSNFAHDNAANMKSIQQGYDK
ncbi:MAG: hypothetical protein CG439_1710 [Methylococcaceae bacterium NSP1-2]|nr:putative lipoprotein [Methylococcaceae bacterium]OYV17388.1 MAG: hypothetical protein CG439_1710 [Methylococcaceae bacterium NSP1-2]